ncbi:MAG: lipoyl(octanoyl) transferase LipB [Desulfatiglandales bacterium]
MPLPITEGQVHGVQPLTYRVTLGLMDYREAWALQTRLVAAKAGGTMEQDVLLFLEHPPVFTMGRRGGADNLTVPEDFLASRGIDLVHIERGGDITYHGPGQLVVYPVMDLRRARLGVREFVTALEEVMIRAAADQGVTAERNDLNRGVWVGMRKLGSIGIAIRHGISFHGLALNANTDLAPFSWVHPCGLSGIHMTSLKEERGEEVSMQDLRRSLAAHMERILHLILEEASPDDLQCMI